MEHKLWNILSDFVKKECDGRDESHGYDHMKDVAEMSILICSKMGIKEDTYIYNCVVTSAWLHDVNDHKYFSMDRKLSLNKFLNKIQERFSFTSYFPSNIQTVIDHISYSTEVKIFGRNFSDWSMILPAHLILVRNIVSDADKIFSLGLIGIKRCLQYSRIIDKEANEIIHEKNFIEHYEKNLSKLLYHYISTPVGYQFAKFHHDIMLFEYQNICKKNNHPVKYD